MLDIMDSENLKTWESKDIVANYLARDKLSQPERSILNFLKPDLNNMRMLDIGVGGGRTTTHFVNLVKEYIGIDYSNNMIDACKNKFSNFDNAYFANCDVRSMDIFEDNYFDFILFSYNGIDYISHECRITALKEIHRVSKERGYFCFSSHNLLAAKNCFKLQFSRNPKQLARKIYKFIYSRLINKDYKELLKKDYAVINDGVYNFRLLTYYIKPAYQGEQLNDCGFQDIKIYSLNGDEIGDEIYNNLNTICDNWLYYLCRTKK